MTFKSELIYTSSKLNCFYYKFIGIDKREYKIFKYYTDYSGFHISLFINFLNRIK